MYDLCVGAMGLPVDTYWQMSPSETFRFIKAKTPKIKLGGLEQSDLERMAKDIYENDEYI